MSTTTDHLIEVADGVSLAMVGESIDSPTPPGMVRDFDTLLHDTYL
jgi:hypothetical protein